MKKGFINDIIAFWYCNRSAIGFTLVAFLVGGITLAYIPGKLARVVGTGVMLVIAFVIVRGHQFNEEIRSKTEDTKKVMQLDVYQLWLKEEPWWSRPLMLVILLASWFALISYASTNVKEDIMSIFQLM
jgi:hypothetical protein